MAFVEDLRAILTTLDEHEVPHAVIGAIALDAYGTPRATADIDIQVALDDVPDGSSPVFLDWMVEEQSHDAVFDQPTIILHRATSAIPVELFVARHWLPVQALARTTQIHSELAERKIPVVTAEDFLLMKSAYSQHPSRRRAKAAQDLVDMDAVVRQRRDVLDMKYLKENASRLGTWDLLQGLVDEAEASAGE